MELKLERIYTKPADKDGYRILVDRLWPRGISKVNADLDVWFKSIAPSTDLRKWFGHDPAKFDEFKQKYLEELKNNSQMPGFVSLVATHLKSGNVILLYGAKDTKHNQAIIIYHYLLDQPEIKAELNQ
ncbi:DUF488 domain-containing protein [Fructilactobacillus fructivorans]|uniref:Putative uroporphyrin-III c-methyltransferase n=1 Tax=Fructilactobacillus fructivorans TaxID=1614 RepID=A0A0C1M769_9LACO|nr:DUF488 family protein [Fructilactobacillus fructivorans]KID42209.1 putative uroporphyrin-III c-methyltransferase [Fructilactobacillus fructivorans]MCT0151163.1 DUF488 family protein [Fructilactobacillus fructivorans]MCT2867279.1 DUF488 family protein [Fructilactobacillus fructivorans]MCT2869201.1 DUF488 family protein [Fructilactobacillus fructivorans]MCT2873078.1 DUF488 family protein [Fructilactobacillus fructivorans]